MFFNPGELATWHSGSTMMSWPPDGYFESFKGRFETLCPKVNTLALIVARTDNHGAVVLTSSRLWWSPVSSLKGELSGSFV